MEPTIVNKERINIAGVALHTTTEDGRNRREIPQFWQDIMQDGRFGQIHTLPGGLPDGDYGICANMVDGSTEFDYVIGSAVADLDKVPDTFFKLVLEPCTYAVFTVPPAAPPDFSKAIQDTGDRIFQEWLPQSEYEFAKGHMDFELYVPRDGDVGCDIYIPVVKK